MTACLIALFAGCAKPAVRTGPISCDTYNVVRFDGQHVLDWLVANDRRLVRDVIANNELAELCK